MTGGVGKVQPHLRDSLSSVTDGSTIDASHVTLQELSLKEDEVEGDEDVFTPLSRLHNIHYIYKIRMLSFCES